MLLYTFKNYFSRVGMRNHNRDSEIHFWRTISPFLHLLSKFQIKSVISCISLSLSKKGELFLHSKAYFSEFKTRVATNLARRGHVASKITPDEHISLGPFKNAIETKQHEHLQGKNSRKEFVRRVSELSLPPDKLSGSGGEVGGLQ